MVDRFQICFQIQVAPLQLGGRPGSSLYFVGAQDDNLFYLDPHTVHPAVPLQAGAYTRPLQSST
jgi:hypothetical protein